jgi:hypothetical protein
MRQVVRNDWIEALGALSHDQVAVDPLASPGSRPHSWRLRHAEFAPFDDLIEIELSDEGGTMRVLIDHPLEMWVDETGPHPGRLLITSDEGPLLLSFDSSIEARPARPEHIQALR